MMAGGVLRRERVVGVYFIRAQSQSARDHYIHSTLKDYKWYHIPVHFLQNSMSRFEYRDLVVVK